MKEKKGKEGERKEIILFVLLRLKSKKRKEREKINFHVLE